MIEEDMQRPYYKMQKKTVSSQEAPKIILYSYRWVVLTCFGLSVLALGMLVGTCTTTSGLLVNIYSLSILESNLSNFAYTIMFIPFNFVSNAVLNRYGIKICLLIGSLIMLIGAWIRILVLFTDKNPIPFLIGSFIGASGQPFILNLASKIASTWFGDKERAIATAIGLMALPAGSILSFILPSTVISDSDFVDLESGKKHFCLYLSIQTIFVTVLFIPGLAFMREEPPTPPSVVAYVTKNGMGFKDGFKELIKNKNFLLLFLIFIMLWGIYASLSPIYGSLANIYHYSISSISICCLLFLLGGILSAFVMGTILDKYQNYKKLLVIICLLSVAATLLHFITLPFGSPMLEGTCMMFIGIAIIPIQPLAFTFAVELTFPVPEAFSNGVMMTTSLIVAVLDGNGKHPPLLMPSVF